MPDAAQQLEDFQPLIASIGQQFPALQPHLQNLVVQRGTPSGPDDDRQLEFYPPWESNNPNPGKLTTELFNKNIAGQDLTETVAGDMLHHLGGTNPATGQPVDPAWMALKQRLIAARGVPQSLMDAEAYQREKASPYGAAPFDEWLKNNRSDAYIRGGVFPKQNPQWQNGEMFTPAMQGVIGEMRSYLTTPRK